MPSLFVLPKAPWESTSLSNSYPSGVYLQISLSRCHNQKFGAESLVEEGYGVESPDDL